MSRARALIIGAGAAGASAASWLHDLQVPFRWIDADRPPTGTLLRVGNPIMNFPGGPWESGPALASHLWDSVARQGLRPDLACVDAVSRAGDRAWSVTTTPSLIGGEGPFDALLLCTGTRPRLLGLEGEQDRLGRGVEVSVTRRRADYVGCAVAVVGGGDAALEGALLLTEVCEVVHLIHRGRDLAGQRRFVARVAASDRIVLHLGRTVASIDVGDDANRIGGVRLDDGRSLEVSGLFVRVGVVATLPTGIPESALDVRGYLACDGSGRARPAGLYGAGDVASAEHQSVSWAVGSAARAASAIRVDLGY